jgi:hypothetical protein
MLRKLAFYAAGLAPGLMAASALAQATIVIEPVPSADPPRTSIEDTRERYRASRAAEKPIAETPADAVEVGEGAPARQIEPADPSLDPSSDELAIPGAPQDPTLLRPALPVGYDQLELAEPVRARLLVVVKDYDGRIRDVLRKFNHLHSQTIGIEAAALADSERTGNAVIVEGAPGERVAGFRPGDVPAGDRPAEIISAIPADSPYAAASAESWKKLHALHLKAVRLQAEKLLALEKGLSPEQIEVLRTYRARPRTAPATEVLVPAAPGAVVPAQPARPIRQNVDVDNNEIEIKQKSVSPDGTTIKSETELPRLDNE